MARRSGISVVNSSMSDLLCRDKQRLHNERRTTKMLTGGKAARLNTAFETKPLSVNLTAAVALQGCGAADGAVKRPRAGRSIATA